MTQPLGAVPLPPVIDHAEVERLRSAGHDVVLADVRWYLDGRDGHAAFADAHIAGAVFVDLEAVLSRHDLAPTAGRHPLPDPVAFAASMTALGIGDATVVVGYDDGGGMTSGRLVVMLRMLGRAAAVLDGGLAGWAGPVATGPFVAPAAAVPSFTPAPWPADRLATVDEVATGGTLALDARSYQRYTGEVTQIDPRPGHVPGARSAPWESVLDPSSGRFRGADELRSHFADRGVTDDGADVITYCGSGLSACMNVLAMERAGLRPPRLYVASFSGWSADPDRDVETGDPRQ